MDTDYNKLKLFWEWLVEGYPKGALTEIRLMNVKDDRLYSVVDKFMNENPSIIVKNNSQFFINNYNDLQKIIEYRNNQFMRYSKVCYSLNPRFYVNGNITGSYDNLRIQTKIFFDIEKIDHSALSDIERDRIEYRYLRDTTEYLRRYGLISPTVIRSGGGLHLIYKITPKEITEGRKEAYKDFINEIKDKMSDKEYHIDYVIDFTRTVALPETLNPKSGFKVNYITLGGQNDFFIKAKKIKKIKPKVNEESDSEKQQINVRESLVWKLLTTEGLPEGEQNNTLLYYIKMLIRDSDDDFHIYQRELNSIYKGKWNFNPKTGIKGKTRQFGLLVNFCRRNEAWCKEKGINYNDYKY